VMPASRIRTLMTAPLRERGTSITLPASAPEATASLVLFGEADHGEGDGEEDVTVAIEVGHLDRPARRLLDPRPDAGADDAARLDPDPFETGLAVALKVADVLSPKVKGVEHGFFSPGNQLPNSSSIHFFRCRIQSR